MDIGWVVAQIAISVFLSLGATFIFFKIKYGKAEKAVSQGMKALSSVASESRTTKAIEKGIAQDILNAQIPELKMLLEYVSPETLDMIMEHPEMALNLVEKYKPLIDKLMGTIQGGAGQTQNKTYEY